MTMLIFKIVFKTFPATFDWLILNENSSFDHVGALHVINFYNLLLHKNPEFTVCLQYNRFLEPLAQLESLWSTSWRRNFSNLL